MISGAFGGVKKDRVLLFGRRLLFANINVMVQCSCRVVKHMLRVVDCGSSATACAIFADSKWCTSCAAGAGSGTDAMIAAAVGVATLRGEVGTTAALDDLDDLVMVQWGRVIATVDQRVQLNLALSTRVMGRLLLHLLESYGWVTTLSTGCSIVEVLVLVIVVVL